MTVVNVVILLIYFFLKTVSYLISNLFSSFIRDCGIYLLAFAEYLSEGEGIPVQYLDSKLYRIRYVRCTIVKIYNEEDGRRSY